MLFKNKLILASGSPRRRELIGYLFENNSVLLYSCDEPKWAFGQSPKDYLDLCIASKWCAATSVLAQRDMDEGTFLLVADTIVVQGSRVLGKPTSAKDAYEMLDLLNRKSHTVFTAIRLGAYQKKTNEFLFKDNVTQSKLNFRKLNTAEIKTYIKSKEPMDKAGAYGFQGIGMHNIDFIQGSYSGIVGLPLLDLKKLAIKLGAYV